MGANQELVRSFYQYVETNSGDTGSRLFRRRLKSLATNGSMNGYAVNSLGRSDREMLNLLRMIGDTMTDGVARQQLLLPGEIHRASVLLDLAPDPAFSQHSQRFYLVRKKLQEDQGLYEFASNRFPIAIALRSYLLTSDQDSAPTTPIKINAITVERSPISQRRRIPGVARASGKLAA